MKSATAFFSTAAQAEAALPIGAPGDVIAWGRSVLMCGPLVQVTLIDRTDMALLASQARSLLQAEVAHHRATCGRCQLSTSCANETRHRH